MGPGCCTNEHNTQMCIQVMILAMCPAEVSSMALYLRIPSLKDMKYVSEDLCPTAARLRLQTLLKFSVSPLHTFSLTYGNTKSGNHDSMLRLWQNCAVLEQ